MTALIRTSIKNLFYLNNLQKTNFELESNNPDEKYRFIKENFIKIGERHLLFKKKSIRGNQAPVINKELIEEIYNRSRLKNILFKYPIRENKVNYKKQRNRYVSLKKKTIKLYFQHISRSSIISNKNFWSTMKPFFTIKRYIGSNEIIIKKGNKTITLTTPFKRHVTVADFTDVDQYTCYFFLG